MKIKALVVSNMYPGVDVRYPYAGVFVKEQIDSLRKTRNVDVEYFLIRGHKGKLFYIIDTLRLFFTIAKGGYQIVHFHYGLSALVILLRFFLTDFPKIIITFHGGDILPKQGKRIQVAISRVLAARADFVICLSDEMINEVSNIDVPKKLIPCGVDFDLFFPRSEKEGVLILFPGDRQRSVKNFPYFEKIFSEYVRLNPSASFRELHGLDRGEIAELMRNASAILMTSVSEGSPQSIKEALATDLAVVSTDVGDVKYVCNGLIGTKILEGFTSPGEAANSLHKAIIAAKESPGVRREHVKKIGLNNSDIALEICAVYEKVYAE